MLHHTFQPGYNHIPYNWVPADAAALAAITVAAADVYKTALQVDEKITWIAIATGAGADKWVDITAGGLAALAASQAEMETGTEAAIRSMSPQRVAQAVDVRTAKVPENTSSANYTLLKTDAGTCRAHPAADANARTFTIGSVADEDWDAGSVLTFKNETAQILTIAVTAQTLTMAGSTNSGSMELAQNGIATAHLNAARTVWLISGTGLNPA